MATISLLDVKEALRDPRFRNSLPASFTDELNKYIQNPGCACNTKFYRRILQDASQQLKDYFPSKEAPDLAAEIKKLAENEFHVINCQINELEGLLKKLPPGRKQIEMARWQDQVTVIWSQMEVLY